MTVLKIRHWQSLDVELALNIPSFACSMEAVHTFRQAWLGDGVYIVIESLA